MLPVGLGLGLGMGRCRDGAIRQSIEIQKQRMRNMCSVTPEDKLEVVGKSSETIIKGFGDHDPERYGTEYHLEGLDYYIWQLVIFS